MPIRTAAPPQGTYDAVASHLGHPHTASKLLPSDGEMGAAEPIPVYMLGLDDLAGGRVPEALRDLKPLYWRHLLVRGGEPVGEADLVAGEEETRVVAVHHGPRAPGTARALAAMQSHPRVARQDYELRMLESPAIYLVSLWLHAPGDEVLVPVEPDRSGLPLHQPITLSEALPQLRQRAAEVLDAQERFPGHSGG
ncbi:MAG TPA: hypothetical protein VFS20_01975 [Longimicrobium sp.]|nr:hypothetical protein [Longimicrobium sp.]